MQPGVRDDEVVEYLPPLRVAPPRPRVPGGTEFYGAVPKHSATFAWSELCATPSPEDALAPVPQIPMKTWYNSYGYIPEESQEDRHFLGRFTGGPNDEWIDRVKAQRLVKAMDDQRQRQMRRDMQREMGMAGMQSTGAEGALQAPAEDKPKKAILAEASAQVRKIFVGGIPQDVTQDELYEFFSRVGTVKKAWLQRNRQASEGGEEKVPPQRPQNHRGFGFVIFHDSNTVDELLGPGLCCYMEIKDGRRIEVKRAKSSNDISRERQAPPNVSQQLLNFTQYAPPALHPAYQALPAQAPVPTQFASYATMNGGSKRPGCTSPEQELCTQVLSEVLGGDDEPFFRQSAILLALRQAREEQASLAAYASL